MQKLKFLIIATVLFYFQNNWTSFQKANDHYPEMNAAQWGDVLYFSKLNELPPMLVCSVIRTESNFKDNAVNKRSGAQSLMQAMPVHGYLMDRKKNLAFGTKYLRDLITWSHGNVAFALARYHAGPNRNLSKYKCWQSYVMVIYTRAEEARFVQI